MPRGGKRSTSFKPGQSGNPRGRPRRVSPEGPQVAGNGIRVCLDIAPAGVRALRRCGLIGLGDETDQQAIARGVLEAAGRYLGLVGG
jgi:hypothetical protein